MNYQLILLDKTTHLSDEPKLNGMILENIEANVGPFIGQGGCGSSGNMF